MSCSCSNVFLLIGSSLRMAPSRMFSEDARRAALSVNNKLLARSSCQGQRPRALCGVLSLLRDDVQRSLGRNGSALLDGNRDGVADTEFAALSSGCCDCLPQFGCSEN